MSGFADKLNDRQIAAVASCIRTSWGDEFGGVKQEEVAQIRKKFESMGEQSAMRASHTGH